MKAERNEIRPREIPGVRTDSEKYIKARAGLDTEEKRLQFDSLLEDYAFAALTRYGRAYVSYDVIADLIRAGWRGPDPGMKHD